ncbi:MAG: helix-turn-helix transcriptional regulator [Candidatus Krumholzibacteriota bacterium]|nr:helix-turn-helix transcriptional regulator [Candidatus Krumholzibacteriota bacterium]
MSIKTNLRRYRLAADGMTQQELAERVGVTRQTIISIEKGKYKPSVELALRLARVFGAPVEDLFELAETEESGR